MKVLIYSHSFAPDIGGVETYAMLLAQGLTFYGESEKVEVTIATSTSANGFNDSTLPFRVVRRPGIAALAKLIRHSDVINLAGPTLAPMLLCKMLRKPMVVEHHGYQAICPNGLLLFHPKRVVCNDRYMRGRYLSCLECNASETGLAGSLKMLILTGPRRWLCGRASVNLCISQHVLKRMRLRRSVVVYYGVPGENEGNQVAVAEPTLTQGAAGPTLTIAYVGRLVFEKDVMTLVEAVRLAHSSNHNVRLKIIGDGPERERIEKAIKSGTFDPPILLTGFLVGDALAEALKSVQIVVIPTMMEETAGLAVMEQMMRGRPVIVSDIGGLAEVAGDGGLTFPPGDANALAECLRRLIDHPDWVVDLGRKAGARAHTVFTQARMVDEHRRIFESLTAGRPN
jgi:glycogen(starch) synthase